MSFLIAIGGHTGTGKTTLAYGLRRSIAFLHGALILDNDQVRRELLGADLKKILTDEDYAPEVSARVLQIIEEKTREALIERIPVINCSGFFRQEERDALPKLAQDLDRSFIGIWLVAPRDVMKERISKRLYERETLAELRPEDGHASDACHGVIEKYGDIGLPSSDRWHIIDACASADTVLATVMTLVSTQMQTTI